MCCLKLSSTCSPCVEATDYNILSLSLSIHPLTAPSTRLSAENLSISTLSAAPFITTCNLQPSPYHVAVQLRRHHEISTIQWSIYI